MRPSRLALVLAWFAALPAFAATDLTFQKFVDGKLIPLVDTSVVPILYILAFIFFLIGIVRYFFTGGEENRQTGRTYVVWSLIGFVVIFAVWGILRLLLSVIPGT